MSPTQLIIAALIVVVLIALYFKYIHPALKIFLRTEREKEKFQNLLMRMHHCRTVKAFQETYNEMKQLGRYQDLFPHWCYCVASRHQEIFFHALPGIKPGQRNFFEKMQQPMVFLLELHENLNEREHLYLNEVTNRKSGVQLLYGGQPLFI